MLAAFFYGNGRIELKDVEEPNLAGDEALLHVMATGICGSDLHIKYGKYPLGLKYPMIPGHEVTGEVVKVGSRVKSFVPGDRVVIEPHAGCDICINCARGYRSSCLYYGTELDRVIGFTVPGGFAEYVAVPLRNLHKLPEKIEYGMGTLLTTAGTPMFGVEEIGIEAGDTVAVLGTGPVGLLALQIVKAKGAGEIIITGRRDERLGLAEDLGADKSINVTKEDFVQRIKEMTDGVGVDVVVESAGVPENFSKSLEIVRKGGRVLLLAFYGGERIQADIDQVVIKGITLKGTRGEAQGGLVKSIRLAEAGKLRLEPLLTHKFRLANIGEAFDVHEKRIGDPIKVAILVGAA